jgi:hypothetical protein
MPASFPLPTLPTSKSDISAFDHKIPPERR